MEAMACGLPTIGTGWGGSTEFMSRANSFLLNYSLVPTDSVEADPPDGATHTDTTAIHRQTPPWRAAQDECRACPGGRALDST